jgi:HSP20 family molecular chaperone IbpA
MVHTFWVGNNWTHGATVMIIGGALMSTNLRNGSVFHSDFPALREDFFFPIEQHFNQIFNDFFGKNSLNSVVAKSGYPKMDVGVEGTQFVVRVALPGLEEKDVQVELTPERILRIGGQMSDEFQSPEGSRYWAKELRKSEFLREVALPKDLEGDPSAMMKAGILTLSWDLPKKPEEKKPRTKLIEIKPG